MFGRKNKPPPAVVPKVTVTRTTSRAKSNTKGEPPVARQQQTETLTLESLPALPDDPVELVRVYKSIKPQYQQALEIVGQLGQTMNLIADKLEDDSDGEIVLARVGTDSGGVRKSRMSQAARLAAELADDEDVSVRVGHRPQAWESPNPKAEAGQWEEQSRPPSGSPYRNLYPGLPQTEELQWQAETATPREALANKMQYIPPQGRISESDDPAWQVMDPEIAELRASSQTQAEMGLQQRLQGAFANTAAQHMARSPFVAQVPVVGGIPQFGIG